MFPPGFAATCKTICLYSDPHFHTYGPAIKDIIHEQGVQILLERYAYSEISGTSILI